MSNIHCTCLIKKFIHKHTCHPCHTCHKKKKFQKNCPFLHETHSLNVSHHVMSNIHWMCVIKKFIHKHTCHTCHTCHPCHPCHKKKIVQKNCPFLDETHSMNVLHLSPIDICKTHSLNVSYRVMSNIHCTCLIKKFIHKHTWHTCHTCHPCHIKEPPENDRSLLQKSPIKESIFCKRASVRHIHWMCLIASCPIFIGCVSSRNTFTSAHACWSDTFNRCSTWRISFHVMSHMSNMSHMVTHVTPVTHRHL